MVLEEPQDRRHKKYVKDTSGKIKNITIKDVANSANVSITTVSLVLRNKPDRLVRIPEATRQRVHEVARKLNYKPNRLAQRFVRQQSNCLGVVLPGDTESLSTPYFGQTLAGIVSEATRNDYRVLLLTNLERIEHTDMGLDLIEQREIDGIITIANALTSGGQLAQRAGFISLYRNPPDTRWISPDETDATFELLSHLMENGYRKIATVWTDTTNGLDRKRAYLEFCEAHNLPIPEEWCIKLRPEQSDFRQDLYAMLSLKNRPDAIYLAISSLSITVYEVAAELNISIPKDLAVAGSGNSAICPMMQPPLTSVNKPYQDMGSLAVRDVLEQIRGFREGKPSLPPEKQLLPCKLIIRESTSPQHR